MTPSRICGSRRLEKTISVQGSYPAEALPIQQLVFRWFSQPPFETESVLEINGAWSHCKMILSTGLSDRIVVTLFREVTAGFVWTTGASKLTISKWVDKLMWQYLTESHANQGANRIDSLRNGILLNNTLHAFGDNWVMSINPVPPFWYLSYIGKNTMRVRIILNGLERQQYDGRIVQFRPAPDFPVPPYEILLEHWVCIGPTWEGLDRYRLFTSMNKKTPRTSQYLSGRDYPATGTRIGRRRIVESVDNPDVTA